MAKKKKLTPKQQANRQAYNKELRRIKQFIRRAQKRGYQFPEDVVPKTPKRITKSSISKLKKIKPETLYKKAVYGGEATGGEVVSGEQGRKAERQASAKKGAETRKKKKEPPKQEIPSLPYTGFAHTVIENFKSDILRLPKEISSRVISFVNQLIQQQGEEDLAEALQDMPETFFQILRRLGYDSESALQGFASSLVNYLPNASDQYKSDLMEAFEMNEIGYIIED